MQKEGAVSDLHMSLAYSADFKISESLHDPLLPKIEGYDFSRSVDYSQLLKHMVSTGFQAANLGDAIAVVNDTIEGLLMRLLLKIAAKKKKTQNMGSLRGVKEIVRYLVENHMVDVVVTTTGGIEEDLIKCLSPIFKGDFSLPGAPLRSKVLKIA
ncbi:hypothetical protein QQ045_019776 [Rhodiola kirilowii]